MKRLLVIPLLLFYLTGMSGISVNSFYCCGRLSSVKIAFEGAYNSHTSKSAKKGCCDNITHFYKVNDAQQISTQNFSFQAPVLQIHFLPAAAIDFIAHSFAKAAKTNSRVLHSPPLSTTLPLFILNESFLI